MKTIIAAAAIAVAIGMPAHAGNEGVHGRGIYAYNCHVAGNEGPHGIVTVDEKKGTLTWLGATFRDLKQVEGGKVTWQATNNNVTAVLSTATQGVADLTIGKDVFECQMVRSKSRKSASP
jgi:hypothetical protein